MTGPRLSSAPTSTVLPLALPRTIFGARSPTFKTVLVRLFRSPAMWRSMMAWRSGGTRLNQPARYSASCSFKDIDNLLILKLQYRGKSDVVGRRRARQTSEAVEQAIAPLPHGIVIFQKLERADAPGPLERTEEGIV